MCRVACRASVGGVRLRAVVGEKQRDVWQRHWQQQGSGIQDWGVQRCDLRGCERCDGDERRAFQTHCEKQQHGFGI